MKEFEVYITGTGQRIRVHTADKCVGRHCPIHNPSDHPMKDYPTHWRQDRNMMERICPHGVGHPDPDDLAYKKSIGDSGHLGIHGCDGCCKSKESE